MLEASGLESNLMTVQSRKERESERYSTEHIYLVVEHLV